MTFRKHLPQSELATALSEERIDAFAAGAGVTAPTLTVAPPPAPSPPTPTSEPEFFSMSVRFTRAEKRALEKLAAADQRSQQQIVSRLLGPLLIEAARKLG